MLSQQWHSGEEGCAGSKLVTWRDHYISLFTRSYLCNSLVHPAMLYARPLFPVRQGSFSIGLGLFIWRSPWERTRSNLFLNPARECQSQIGGSKIFVFRDQKDPLMRAAFQGLGCVHLQQGVVTTDPLSVGSKRLHFYSEVSQAIRFLERLFSSDCLLVVGGRKPYWNAIASVLPLPMYQNPTIGSSASRVLSRAMKLPVPTSTKDFLFRAHADILPVKTRNRDGGFYVPWSFGRCVCGVNETLDHVPLWHVNAQLFWAKVRTFFDSSLNLSWLSLRFLESGSDDGRRELGDLVVLLGSRALWHTRANVVECILRPNPACWHFVIKVS